MNDYHSKIIDQQTQTIPKTFIARVFSWMAIALGISGVAAWLFSHDPALMNLMRDETGMTGFGKFMTFAPLILVFAIGYTMQKGSYITNIAMFLLFSLSMGISLSYIFFYYQKMRGCVHFDIRSGSPIPLHVLHIHQSHRW